MDEHTMTGGGLTVRIKALGAEICAIQDDDGRDYLWPASPPWPRHAPVLFPIVGRLRDDTLRHAGRTYRMTQHGFARDRVFDWRDSNPCSCRLSLADDDVTRKIYPFAFRFEVAYSLGADGLSITYTVANPGEENLPASGAHPAFLWPLRVGVAKEAHRLIFDVDEPETLRGVEGGLLTPPTRPSPIGGRVLPLSVELFDADALILDPPRSRSVRYEGPGGPAIRVSWEGFRELGIWSRKDADLLCIEPWYGTASPTTFDGEFSEKPGLALVLPGATFNVFHRISIED
jgi:galactose mutarotase-like enzyme